MIQILILALAALTEPIQIYNVDDLPREIEITLPYIDIEQNFPDHPGLVQKLDSAYRYMINDYDYRNYYNYTLIELAIWRRDEYLFFTFTPEYSLEACDIDVAIKRNYTYIGYSEYKKIPVVICKAKDVSGLKISSSTSKKKKFLVSISGPYIDDGPYWSYKTPIKNIINNFAPHSMMLYEMCKYAKWRLHKIENYIISLKLSLQENMKSEKRYRYWYWDLPYWRSRGIIY